MKASRSSFEGRGGQDLPRGEANGVSVIKLFRPMIKGFVAENATFASTEPDHAEQAPPSVLYI
jgi:hypothetical protein